MNYRELKKLNQSILKKILISPKEYLRAKEKQEQGEQSIAPHFVFGSVVDIMLVGSKDEFEEKFVRIPDETKCSEAVKTIVDGVVAEMLELDSTLIDRNIILRHCNNVSYYNNWKDDTRIDKILVDGKDYFELLKTTAGKTPITESEYAKAVGCVMALKSDKFTKPYVDKKHDKDVEFWDKFIIEFDYKGFAMKGELDRVCINKPQLIAVVPDTLVRQPKITHSVTKRADRLIELGQQITMSDGWRAFHVRNEYMVDHANIAVSFWNRQQKGGTYACITYFLNQGKDVHNVKIIGEDK